MHRECEHDKKGGGRVKKGRGGGQEGEKASTRARGHKAAAMTAGMSLTASTSSQEDDSKDVEAHRTSVVPHRTQTASRQVTDMTTDTMNLNVTHAEPTRPEGESYNPPDKAQSISLKGRRTGASDELSAQVPVDESTTMQLTWTP